MTTSNTLISALYFIDRLETEIGDGVKVKLEVCEEEILKIIVHWESYDFTFSYSCHANNIKGMSDEAFISFFVVYVKAKFRAMLNVQNSL
jgi:hypothetical protein